MGIFSKRFGYQSPAVGTWTFALSLELALGVILILVGHNGEETKALLEQANLLSSKYTSLLYFGLAHVVIAVAVGAVVALGLFVSSCFLLPLCIISVVQSLVLVATAIWCGVLVRPYSQEVRRVLFEETDVKPSEPGDLFLAYEYGGYLLFAACVSLGALAAFGRAGGMKNDTPIVEAQLYVPCGTLLVCSATLAAVGGAGQGSTLWMATILYGLAGGLAILVGIANCCCTPKVFNIVVGAGFACIAVFSLIFCGMAVKIYCDVIHTYDYYEFNQVDQSKPPKPFPEDWKVFNIMHQGSWLLAFACTTLATAVLAIFAALYALRSVLFCFGKGDTA